MTSLRTPSRYAYTHPNVIKYHVSCRSSAVCASSIQQIPEIKDVLYLDPPSIRRERASQPAAVRIRANGGGSRCAPPFRGGATCVHAELRRLPYDLSSTLYFSSVPPNLVLEEMRIERNEHLDTTVSRLRFVARHGRLVWGNMSELRPVMALLGALCFRERYKAARSMQ